MYISLSTFIHVVLVVSLTFSKIFYYCLSTFNGNSFEVGHRNIVFHFITSVFVLNKCIHIYSRSLFTNLIRRNLYIFLRIMIVIYRYLLLSVVYRVNTFEGPMYGNNYEGSIFLYIFLLNLLSTNRGSLTLFYWKSKNVGIQKILDQFH